MGYYDFKCFFLGNMGWVLDIYLGYLGLGDGICGSRLSVGAWGLRS